MTTLVELCAGSAAVSLRWLHPRAKPPIAYQGGKRAYADAILLAMGLRPGGGQRAGRVVLVEAGPWGEAWAHWAAGGIPDTVERLRAWSSVPPRELWARLKEAPLPGERAERVATWAVLQRSSYGGKPVFPVGDRWRWSQRPGRKTAHTLCGPREEIDISDYPERIAENLLLLRPFIDDVDVVVADARSVEPIPGAHVYLDPDYAGTTGYGHTLPRADVLRMAEWWRAAGCSVAVSEAEPLALDGWHAHRLPRSHGRGRTFSRQQQEWLTLSERPVGALPFGDAIGAT